ncbi:histidinol-phosphate transaminase [Dissulfurirhabdus thermomarina]|uniref:Histidinol-phosphate aminotransferase n=1 Tax=Dissulfurirhabdus thermomarina TaxID=1765737 RepID=A0A6N9TTK2_DISTH|nr:histidinol-phosphate transaminase [Dissulfurirhabdus thermomarina]NDY43433.1 histidinol-phosphate transaminase [Dissulfurirhabdus thermomarina]NMX23526.1 histidinol-phosphate transaminase [Dissulfurirhabdus thermomarina]
MKELRLHVPAHIADLVPYPPGKPLEELEREYGITGAVKLASNENPLGPSPKAVAAVREAAANLHRYPDGSGYYLKHRLAERLGVDLAGIVLGNGSNELIDLLVRVFVAPGDEVASSDPAFLVYRKMVQAAAGRNVLVPLRGHRHDLPAMARRVTDRTRLVFLDNPHNPTGSILARPDFEAFLADLPETVLVVLDEAYAEFVRGETPRALDYLGRDRRVVGLRTFSKAHGLAGLRVGYGVMDPEVAGYLERVRQPFNVNAAAQAGALAALDDEAHLRRTLEVTWSGMDRLREGLSALGCRVLESHTNFLMADMGRDAGEVYEAVLRRGVILRSMAAYGYPTWIRITVGRPEENERCLAALAEVLTG